MYKILKLTIPYLILAFLLSGCGYSLEPKPEVKQKNSSIKVFIDESAHQVRQDQYIKAYIDLLNNGFETMYASKFFDCFLETANKKRSHHHDMKAFLAPYDTKYRPRCKKVKMLITKEKPFYKVKFKAKKIDSNKIEIETDGTLEDLMFKYFAIQSLATNKKAYSEMAIYGYTNVNIDTDALQNNRLILILYPGMVRIKSIYEDALKKRGYTIVDNYEEANRVIYIENVAALPLNVAGGVDAYYKKNISKVLRHNVTNIQENRSKIIAFKKQNKTSNAPIVLGYTGMLGTSLSGGNSSNIGKAGLAFFAIGLAANLLSPDDRERTYVAYKIIIENKDYDINAKERIDQFRYRAAIFKKNITTWAYLPILKSKLNRDGINSLKKSLAKYFEKDITYKNKFYTVGHELLN